MRHEKWVPVEPGTTIPAGQPYRVEYQSPILDFSLTKTMTAKESVRKTNFTVPPLSEGEVERNWFVDSLWASLPTEPTWGMVFCKNPAKDGHTVDVGCFQTFDNPDILERSHRSSLDTQCDVINRNNIVVFIPLTDEQVARIEASQ